VLGVVGVISAFALFYLGERVFHLDRAHIQTLMYLKLSVAGHLTIFLTRTRGPFWSIHPARILWAAVLGTQILATLIAVYGVFMTPLGWGWALFVWGCSPIGSSILSKDARPRSKRQLKVRRTHRALRRCKSPSEPPNDERQDQRKGRR
jgi:magnesium-transporting ATPase (P-type)